MGRTSKATSRTAGAGREQLQTAQKGIRGLGTVRDIMLTLVHRQSSQGFIWYMYSCKYAVHTRMYIIYIDTHTHAHSTRLRAYYVHIYIYICIYIYIYICLQI